MGMASISSETTSSSVTASAVLSASAVEALLISIRHPVSLAASLAFCPSLPMAKESCLSGTTTVAISVSNLTLSTWAGLRALAIKTEASGSHITTSIFSPFNSLTIFCIRIPRNPTQQPTGSMPSWCAATATLLRYPASRASDFISTIPLKTSGTSSSKSRRSKLGWERDTITRGPLFVRLTSMM